MTALELKGLVGSSALGAMAAFGLLRTLSTVGQPRLRFVERDDWVAVIESDHASLDDLIAWLDGSTRTRSALELGWAPDDVRVAPLEFHDLLASAIRTDASLASFLSALAADGAVDQSKGQVKPTQFYMASGNQKLLGTLRNVHAQLCERGPSLWREALEGPWLYATSEWSAGWDSSAERMHALRYQAPSSDGESRCVAGAVWLAFQGLPLFPTLAKNKRAVTAGFVRNENEDRWRWPLPRDFIRVDTLRTLLGSTEIAKVSALRPGVGAIYEATRYKFGQGYAIFRPARRLA